MAAVVPGEILESYGADTVNRIKTEPPGEDCYGGVLIKLPHGTNGKKVVELKRTTGITVCAV